jgi:ribosomal protein L11 methyltransferase
VPAHPEAVDAVSEILSRVGHNGIAVELPLEEGADAVVKAYVVDDHVAKARVRRVREALGHLQAFGLGPIGELRLRAIADEDWLESWKASFTPLRSGAFLIVPTWSTVPPGGGIVLWLDPGMAFGTGLHPTTQQCLEALSPLELDGRSMLDVGCGSGILSLAAAKRGAAPIVAVDTDELAVRATRENAERNGVAVDARQGSAAEIDGTFDVVLANIVAPVLRAIAGELRARLADGGTLIVAGIIATEEEETRMAFDALGLAVSSRDQRGDWVSLALEVSSRR